MTLAPLIDHYSIKTLWNPINRLVSILYSFEVFISTQWKKIINLNLVKKIRILIWVIKIFDWKNHWFYNMLSQACIPFVKTSQ